MAVSTRLYIYIYIGPHPVTMANKGLGWDSLVKRDNPGGNWLGVDPICSMCLVSIPRIHFHIMATP